MAQFKAAEELKHQEQRKERARRAAMAPQSTIAAIIEARRRFADLAAITEKTGEIPKEADVEAKLRAENPALSHKGFATAWLEEAPLKWRAPGRLAPT